MADPKKPRARRREFTATGRADLIKYCRMSIDILTPLAVGPTSDVMLGRIAAFKDVLRQLGEVDGSHE